MAANSAFLLNHGYEFTITEGLLGSTPLSIGAGITSVEPDNNEEVSEDYYYDGGGAATTDVTGVQLSYGFEGHRDYNDLAQNHIFSLRAATGPARKTNFVVTEPNGDKWEGPATISEITAPGGDANSKGEIEFTITFDGQPTFTEAPVTP